MSCVRPWQMDRVLMTSKASANDINQNDVAQLEEHRLTNLQDLSANGRRFESAHRSQLQIIKRMKAIIQSVTRTYRTTKNVKVDGHLHEIVKRIDVQTSKTTIFGVPVLSKYTIEGEEKLVKFCGIPIKSFRRELWDHLSESNP